MTPVPPPESWRASLAVRADSQGQTVPGGITLAFGVQQGATEGFDPNLDNPASPPPPASTNIQPHFRYPNNPPGPPDTRRLQISIVPPATTNEWLLRVFFQADEGATANVTITWSLTNVPAGKQVRLLSSDRTQVLVADMRAVSQYQFTMTAGAVGAALRDLVVLVALP